MIQPCWSSSAAQLAYAEIQVELELFKAAACHWTEHDLMIPLALSARNCQKTAEENNTPYTSAWDYPGHSSSLIPSILLFFFPFDASACTTVGRNDLPLIDVTSHHSFMVLRLGNGELERFLSCAFPFCFILDMRRLIPKLRPLQVGSGLSAAHSSNICSLLEFVKCRVLRGDPLVSIWNSIYLLASTCHGLYGRRMGENQDQAQVSTPSTSSP